MNELEQVQERIAAALNRLKEQNDGFFGLGGAAGDPDDEQLHALRLIAWRLENAVDDILEMIGG